MARWIVFDVSRYQSLDPEGRAVVDAWLEEHHLLDTAATTIWSSSAMGDEYLVECIDREATEARSKAMRDQHKTWTTNEHGHRVCDQTIEQQDPIVRRQRIVPFTRPFPSEVLDGAREEAGALQG